MMIKEKNVAKIKPERYKKILEGLELRKIYVKNFKGQIDLDVIRKAMVVNISSTAEFVAKHKNEVEISQKWDVVARTKDSQSECLTVSVTYCVVLHSKEEFTRDFFEIYEKTNLPFNLWPFVREFVNSMTARMNVPPLTLPLFKLA